MNKKYMQLQSLILVFAVTLSCASCGKDPKVKKEGRKITEDTPWFNANIIEVDTGVDKDRNIGASMSSFTGSDEDLYVIYTGGMYALSLEEEEDVNDYETYTNNYSFDFVSVIDQMDIDFPSVHGFGHLFQGDGLLLIAGGQLKAFDIGKKIPKLRTGVLIPGDGIDEAPAALRRIKIRCFKGKGYFSVLIRCLGSGLLLNFRSSGGRCSGGKAEYQTEHQKECNKFLHQKPPYRNLSPGRRSKGNIHHFIMIPCIIQSG